MRPSVAIRADAGLELGSGHIRRCLTVAQHLHESGAAVGFISRSGPGDCFDEIRSAGFSVTAVPPEGDDLLESLTALHALRAQAVIVDHYALDDIWERSVEQIGVRVAVVDDLANRQHHCSILIDQNITATLPGRYAGLVNADCRLLLGPAFAMLRPQFDAAERRERTGGIGRIAVSFGGYDAPDATSLILEAISRSNLRDVPVDAILDGRAPHAASVRAFCERTQNMRFTGAVENMAQVLEQVDLAIGACGTSQWERAYLGVPTLLVSIAENQEPGAALCAERGIAAYAGRIEGLTVEKATRLLNALAADPLTLRRYSRASLKMMGSGGGAAAVARAVLDLC